MTAAADRADRARRRRRRAQQGGRSDDRGGSHGRPLLRLQPLTEKGRREDLVPAFERLLELAISVEERCERVDRLGKLLTKATRLGVVGPAGDGIARRYRVRHL